MTDITAGIAGLATSVGGVITAAVAIGLAIFACRIGWKALHAGAKG